MYAYGLANKRPFYLVDQISVVTELPLDHFHRETVSSCIALVYTSWESVLSNRFFLM